jgi:hypothetical protein
VLADAGESHGRQLAACVWFAEFLVDFAASEVVLRGLSSDQFRGLTMP